MLNTELLDKLAQLEKTSAALEPSDAERQELLNKVRHFANAYIPSPLAKLMNETLIRSKALK